MVIEKENKEEISEVIKKYGYGGSRKIIIEEQPKDHKLRGKIVYGDNALTLK